MFAEKLLPLISSFPQDAEALRRMAEYLGDFESRRGPAVFKIRLNPNRLFDIMQAGSTSRLARLVSILVEGEIIRREVVVRFPSGSGITFESYSDLPFLIRDPDRDIDVRVTEENIEASYILVTNEVS